VSRLRQHIDSPYLEIHPEDAQRLEITNGSTARIENDRGSVEARVQITSSIKAGCVFLPMHWGKRLGDSRGRANNITSDRVDPLSKEPDFKFAAVRVRPIMTPVRKIVVVGAGAAAFEFIQAYRRLNRSDSIDVFGNENEPFYNRILLPDYVKGSRTWEDLCVSGDALLDSLHVNYHAGPGIASIDRAGKTVVTSDGDTVEYDVLVLATGSRPAVPLNTPTDLDNIFTLRNRGDADRIRAQVRPGAEVAVIGGGLLGIEVADALSDIGARCTLVHRSASLMRGVIDETASELLQETLEDRGIELMMSDGVVRYYGDDRVSGLQMRSGRRLSCDIVCIATGITPNAELASACGLNVRRGVVVDEALRTEDASIYAIGEVAEVLTTVYGTTPAAQEQARVAARHISGDGTASYEGTTPMNILKIRDFSLCSVGMTASNDDSVEEVVMLDKTARYYKRCCVKGGCLVGAVLVGDSSELPEYRSLIEKRTELDDIRWTLLRGSGSAAEPPKGAIVCSCYNVGAGNVEDAVAAGCGDLESVCERTCAGTGCGSCRAEVSAIIDRTLQVDLKEVLA
jgi:ferredoxin-nitrate reductase